MKKIISLLILSSMVLFMPACKKLLTFNINYSTSFSIPVVIIVDVPLDIPTPDITTNAEQTFDDHGTSGKYIEQITLSSLTLTITSPQGESFSFLKDIYLYISADGVAEQLVASYEDVPSTAGSTLDLEVSGADLIDFILKDSFKIRAQIVTDEAISNSVDLDADMGFKVEAKNPVF